MIRPKKLRSLEAVLKGSICSIPGLFIYPSTSASISCIYILQQDAEDDKTIQKNNRKRQSKQKPFLYLFGGRSGRLKSMHFGYNLVVTMCAPAKQK